MRLKTLLPLILFMLLLTLMSFAQTPPESPENSGNPYGIKPEQSYPGTLLLELMETAEAEIDAAVNEAYAEGYKAGLTASMTETLSYMELSEQYRRQAERRRLSGWAPLALGFAGGFFIHWMTAR